MEASHQAVVTAGLLAHHGKGVDALDGAHHCLEAARMRLSRDEARHTQQRRAECAGLVREMERELVRLEQLADDVHKVSVAVPQRHEVEAEVHSLREARAAGRAPPEPPPGQLELHMVTEPAVRAHHKRLTNDVWQFVALSRLAAAARRARARIGERASGPPSFALQVASVAAEEEAARLAAEAKVDYLDEAEAAAAAELRRRERHCLVDVCEDEAAQHEKLRRVRAAFAELEIQRGAQARVGERLETRHLDMLYWKARRRYAHPSPPTHLRVCPLADGACVLTYLPTAGRCCTSTPHGTACSPPASPRRSCRAPARARARARRARRACAAALACAACAASRAPAMHRSAGGVQGVPRESARPLALRLASRSGPCMPMMASHACVRASRVSEGERRRWVCACACFKIRRFK